MTNGDQRHRDPWCWSEQQSVNACPSSLIPPSLSGPSLERPKAQGATRADELDERYAPCRDGRLDDVERSLALGRPMHPTENRAADEQVRLLQLALEAGNHSLVLLLLANGYDANREAGRPVDHALRGRRFDLVTLLLDWGSDPHAVGLDDLFDTYSSTYSSIFTNWVLISRRDTQRALSRSPIFSRGHGLPKNIGRIIEHHLWWATFGDPWRRVETLRHLLRIGTRWEESGPEETCSCGRRPPVRFSRSAGLRCQAPLFAGVAPRNHARGPRASGLHAHRALSTGCS